MTLSGYYYPASAGETFDSISMEIYGDERFAPELMNANPVEAKKLVMTGGELLKIPTVTAARDRQTGGVIGKAPWKE